MAVKYDNGSSIIGKNPTIPPYLGYISSTGNAEWPDPKRKAACPHAMLSAIIDEALEMLFFCVLSIAAIRSLAFSVQLCLLLSITQREKLYY
jgi:hypothetical protein